MSSRNYGIYQQGAVFFAEDFDPCKVILAVSKKICGISIPAKLKTALEQNKFDADAGAELCSLLDIEPEEEITGYSDISAMLVDEAGYNDWFTGADPLMGTVYTDVTAFSGMEGEFVFDNDEKSTQEIEKGFMFTLSFPLVWNIENFQGLKTRDVIVKCIKEAAQTLLKDDIDWDARLGILIGSYYG